MLFIHNDVSEKVLEMADVINVQEDALRQAAEGRAVARPRIDVYVPCDREDGYWRWGTMEGANGGYFAIRMKSDIMTWPDADQGHRTQEKYCIEPGTFCGLIMLFSTRDGEPLALINDGILQHMRVGGAAGIGVKYMWREDSEDLCILGSGGMARTYLDAIQCVRPIKRVRCYSPTKAHCVAFAEEMSERFGLPVEPMDHPHDAVRGCDILACCTDSITPVFDGDWVEPGMHLANLNWHELGREAVAKIDRMSRKGQLDDGLKNYLEGQNSYICGTPEERARIPGDTFEDSPFEALRPDCERIHFEEMLLGNEPGRKSADQVTFFQNSGNQGLQFSSVGALCYAKAKAAGLGRELPTEWFLQDIRD
ncbi:MAG: ornithine cyclodeaminase family protein [Alphaproteobacteria bacterium]|nr:ornithine cyclodeaminase family protein [Alphaproteobacteria bacterium]